MAGAVKIKRSQFATFINTTPSETTANYVRLGKGITSGEISYNPESNEEIYIDEDSGTTDVTGYKPTMPVEATAMAGDDAYDFIDSLRINRAILGDAKTDIVNVWLYKTATGGAYPAEKQNVSIALGTFGGPGGEPAKINYTINYQGDPVKGTFNPTTKAFTATT